MSIRKLWTFPATVCLVLLGMGSMSAMAEHELIMTTVDYDIPGKAAVLRGDYIKAIEVSKKYVDARWYVRRLAARTNLCISYTGLRNFENAAKWCDAAMQVNRSSEVFDNNRGSLKDSAIQASRPSWIAKNNRAVLHLLMGEIGEGHQILEAAEGKVRGSLYQAVNQSNHREAEYREAVAQTSVEPDSLVVKSER